MTFALTRFRAHGVRLEGPTQKRGIQRMVFQITSAATDVDLDLGDFSGTFWGAADNTALGASVLDIVQNRIIPQCAALLSFGSPQLVDRPKVPTAGGGSLVKILSDASAGGNATETYVVTGLLAADTIVAVTPALAGTSVRKEVVIIAGTVAAGSATPTAVVTGLATTDTIIAVTQDVKGANSLPLLGYNTQATNALGLVYSADPGASGTIKVAVWRDKTGDTLPPVAWNTQAANSLKVVYPRDPGTGAKVIVSVLRATTGNYAVDISNQLPNITVATADGETTWTIETLHELNDRVEPVFAEFGSDT